MDDEERGSWAGFAEDHWMVVVDYAEDVARDMEKHFRGTTARVAKRRVGGVRPTLLALAFPKATVSAGAVCWLFRRKLRNAEMVEEEMASGRGNVMVLGGGEKALEFLEYLGVARREGS